MAGELAIGAYFSASSSSELYKNIRDYLWCFYSKYGILRRFLIVYVEFNILYKYAKIEPILIES